MLTGDEEYSLRNAGVAAGLVLIVILPLVCVIIFILKKYYHNYFEKPRPELGSRNLSLIRAKSRSKLSLASVGTLSPTKDGDFSPVSSPISSVSTGTLNPKRRRSYDKVYRTHEPLPGRPDIDFEDKSFDVEVEEDIPESPKYNRDGYLFDSEGYAQLQKPRPQTTSTIVSDV